MYFQLTTRFISESSPDASGPFPTANIQQTYLATGVAADQGEFMKWRIERKKTHSAS